MGISEAHAKKLHEAWREHERALDAAAAAKNDLETAKWEVLRALELSPRKHGISFNENGVARVTSVGG